MSLVQSFTQYRKGDVAKVGGKIANLGELLAANVPGSPGVAVEVEAFRLFIANSPTIQQLIANLVGLPEDEIDDPAAKVREAILAAPMPHEVEAQIQVACTKPGVVYAVRSSATAEDLAGASFAGQQDTYLGVKGPDVILHVKKCWASLFNARAIHYRNQNGFSHSEVGIAVAIQELVRSKVSGVMFTVEPVTGNRTQICIDAIWGLGELLVGGMATPDNYVIDKGKLSLLSYTVTPQEVRLSWNGVGSYEEAVPVDLRNQRKLTDDQLAELAQYGLRIEEHYGGPQDIEWAIDDRGSICILQSRPVTTAHHDDFHDEAEVTEVAPVLGVGFAASPGTISGPVRFVFRPADCTKVQPGDIMVAPMTTPDYMLGLSRCAGVITATGGKNSHAAIVAREQGKPACVGTEGILEVLTDGQIVTVDGSHGKVFAGEADLTLAWGKRRVDRLARITEQMAHVQTRTKVMTIVADPTLATNIAAQANDGVALLRIEFILANHIGEHPRSFIESGRSEEFISRLTDGILAFARAFNPRSVVVRTTDFKTNEYANLAGAHHYENHEENPMLGLRGVRRYLHDPQVYAMECEALRRVIFDHGFKNVIVMFPFVRTPQELAEVIQLSESFGLTRENGVRFWMMVEVPSNVLLLEKFVACGISGVSVGSNDLTQLTLGADRDGQPVLQEHYDEMDEAVQILVQMTGQKAQALGISCSICGNMPTNYPETVPYLIDWGFTSIGVHPDRVAEVRATVALHEQG